MTVRCVRFLAAAAAVLLALAPPIVCDVQNRNSKSFLARHIATFALRPANAETEAEQEITYAIADGGANLRDGHSTDSNVIDALDGGVVVREIKSHSSWRYVEVIDTGERGWVWQELLVALATESNIAEDESDESQESTDSTEESTDDDGNEPTTEADTVGAESADDSTEPVVDVDPNGLPVESAQEDAEAIAAETEQSAQVAQEGGDAIDVKKPKDDEGSESEDDSESHFEGASAEATAGSDLIALITAESVNLRTEPNLRSKVLTQVDTGQKVYIIEERKPWYLVSVPKLGKKGWVFGEFVQPLDYVLVTGDDVNLRAKPDLSSKVIMKLSKGMRFVKKAWQNNYVLVAHPDKGYTGWVHQRYIKVEERKSPPTFIVKGFSVNFRKDPSIVSEVYEQLDTGTKVTVLGREEKWTLVKYRGQSGWMYSEYLVSESDWQKIGGIQGATRSLGTDLISRALELRGTPYVWSGESIKGFDCSGFIYYLIGSATGATTLPRSAADMFEQLGVPVDLEDLKRGDLVFFTTYKAGASHVGLYLGDGDFVHASSAEGEVVISNMSEGYYKEHFIGARRVPTDLFK